MHVGAVCYLADKFPDAVLAVLELQGAGHITLWHWFGSLPVLCGVLCRGVLCCAVQVVRPSMVLLSGMSFTAACASPTEG